MKDIGSLIDKILLIGITLLDKEGELIDQIQTYGPIIRVDADGVVIARNGTRSEFTIPPDFEHITEAQPGEYSLRSTGEVVIDPDYISSWTVHCANKDQIDNYTNFGFSGYEME